jgi:hypothetical protein
MPLYKGKKDNQRVVECCAVGCEGEHLDRKVKELNAGGWAIRQIYQEPPGVYYRIFAQREVQAAQSASDSRALL